MYWFNSFSLLFYFICIYIELIVIFFVWVSTTGRFLAEVTKQVLVDLEASKYQVYINYDVRRYEMSNLFPPCSLSCFIVCSCSLLLGVLSIFLDNPAAADISAYLVITFY